MLEIGTLGGQSAIWCASANEKLKITTIEMNNKFAAVARENLRVAGLEDRVEILEGRAQDILPQLAQDIAKGTRPKYDLVSVDVEAFQYTRELVDMVVELARDGACLLAHCAVRPSNFSVPTEEEKSDRCKGSREMLESVGRNQRLDAVLLMTDGEQQYDTLVAAVRDEA
jgi:predicted O-methyltransferase YrrM